MRMTLLAAAVLAPLLCSTWLPLRAEAGSDPPNVIFIMGDDLGWGDVGFNGNETIQTPHLDAMAANGLNLKRFYAAAPVCSPTRGSVVTGRHPFRYGIYFANTGHLKKPEFTLYEAVKTRGYATGHFGKWHLGTLTTEIKDANRAKPGNTKDYSAPWHHQVDACLVTESKVPTWDPMLVPKPVKSRKNGWPALKPGATSEFYGTYYWTGENQPIPPDSPELRGDDSRVIMDAALAFIEEAVKDETPFLSVIWFHAPHLPVVAGPEYAKLYPDATEYEANYYGCITALDEQVGRLRAQLREWGVAENTMVWFCSDNGPEGRAGKAPGTAGPFRGRKRDLYEGGIRVPALLEWPARIAEARETDFPCGTVDYFPTIMAAVGFEVPDPDRPLDGIDLGPMIDGKVEKRESPLGFQSAKQLAWMEHRYKLHSGDDGRTFALYDLIEDPAETTDLSGKSPEIKTRLIAELEKWRASCRESDAGKDYRD